MSIYIQNSIRQRKAAAKGSIFMRTKKEARAVRGSVSERSAGYKGWSPSFNGLQAGIAFDNEGMHVTKSWPDGEPTYQLIGWNDVSVSKLHPLPSTLLGWVDDVYINDEPSSLTSSQRKSKQLMVDAIFALPERYPIRVRLWTKASTKVARCGKTRSIEAASVGFSNKLTWLRRLHRKTCREIQRQDEERES